MGLQEKEMEIGFAGFFFCLEKGRMWEERKKKEKKEKNERGNALVGQAGIEVVNWLWIVWAGIERYVA